MGVSQFPRWGGDIFKTMTMTNYELKQGLLDKLEIDGLIERIQKLEKQLAEKELELKKMTRELVSLQEDFYKEQIMKIILIILVWELVKEIIARIIKSQL